MFCVRNFKNGRVLAESLKVCRGLDYFKGERFEPQIKPMLFPLNSKKKHKLDTWFCCKRMDIAFLNYDFKIIGLVRGMDPFRFLSLLDHRTRWVLELPYGTLAGCNVLVSDRLVFQSTIV